MNTFQNEYKVRQQICEIGQKLYDKGFVAANDGNISAKISDSEIIVTPTGVSKGGMKPDQLVKMSLDGTILSGKSRPSSEVKMHIQVYQIDPSIKAVVHAHPPISTAFAVARKPMEKPILAEAVVNLGVVPVADFALPGTTDVPDSIKPYVKEYNSVLLANHGLLSWGGSLTEAFFRMESVEHYGKILLYVEQIGGAKEFSCKEIEDLLAIREKIGIASGGVPACKIEHEKINDENELPVRKLIETITMEVIRQMKGR